MSAEPASFSKASWRAFQLLRADYHPVTQFIGVFLAACCVLGIVLAYRGPGLLPTSVAGMDGKALENLLTSDAFRMLLGLLIALMIGISIKRRQVAGVLDGDENYNIGRALAFGYFKNFLVGALQVAKVNGQVLHVFEPHNVEDLRNFERKIWPQVASQFTTVAWEVDPALTAARKPLVRRVIAMQISDAGGQRELWLDFPTTLFTIGDYYESWNRWLVTQNKPMLDEKQLLGFEQMQIAEFFRHLKALMTSDIGYVAVQDHGLTADGLADLLNNHYRLVNMATLTDLLSLPPQGPTPPSRNS